MRLLKGIIYKIFRLFERSAFCWDASILWNRGNKLNLVVVAINLPDNNSIVIDGLPLVAHKYLFYFMTLYALGPVENFPNSACHLNKFKFGLLIVRISNLFRLTSKAHEYYLLELIHIIIN